MAVYSPTEESVEVTVPMNNSSPKDRSFSARSSIFQMDDPANIRDPKRKELRIRLEGMLSGSTISGISQAFSDRQGMYKIFWITLFGLGVVGFAINFYFITEKYVKRPILTQLDRTLQPFKWPHFTFCNPTNPLPLWKSKDLEGKWNTTLKVAHSYILPRYGPKSARRKIWEQYVAMSTLSPADTNKFKHTGVIFKVKVVHQHTTVAASANLLDQYEDVTDQPGIYQSRFDSLRSPIPCYTLMPEKITEAWQHSDKLLAVKLHVIMDFNSHLIYDLGYQSRKLYFYITNPNSTLQSEFPHYILSGTNTHFTVKQKRHERITDCMDETFSVDMFDASMESSHSFTGGYEDCRAYLSQRLFVSKCGCYNPYLPVYKLSQRGTPRLCFNMSLYTKEQMTANVDCLNKVLDDSIHTSSFKYHLASECSKYILPSCVSNSYSVTRNSNVWQDEMNEKRLTYMENLREAFPNSKRSGDGNDTEPEKGGKFIRKNVVVIDIVAGKDSTQFTNEEFEYPLAQYMSDFGGIIGLWIGLSVISIFEIMELILVFIKYVKS